MEIKSAIGKCLADLSLAKRTEMAYRMGLNCFTTYLHTQGIETTEEVTKLSVDNFVYFLPYLNREYSKGTAGVYAAASKALLDWMVIANILQPTYGDTIRIKKAMNRSHKRHEDKLPRFPNKTDVPRMLAAVKLYEDDEPRKERNIALLEFLASSGCRISEATALNVQDINLQSRSTVVTGKGSKERRVFFSTAAAEALEEYWRVRGSAMPTDPAFGRHDKGAGHQRIKRMTPTTARRIVKAVAEIAGIDPSKFSPHYFRHAFAIRVLSETHDLALTQDLMGHCDPKSTRVYAKIHAEDLRDAHRDIFK